jgi:hypothetical protein
MHSSSPVPTILRPGTRKKRPSAREQRTRTRRVPTRKLSSGARAKKAKAESRNRPQRATIVIAPTVTPAVTSANSTQVSARSARSRKPLVSRDPTRVTCAAGRRRAGSGSVSGGGSETKTSSYTLFARLGASIEPVFERSRREEQRGGREAEAQDERQGEQRRFDEGADREHFGLLLELLRASF